MATNRGHSDSDNRETEDEPTSPLNTPGFAHGEKTNPSIIMPSVSPTVEAADFLHGIIEGLRPFGPDFDSVRQQNVFGLIYSTRGAITTKGMQELIALYVTKKRYAEWDNYSFEQAGRLGRFYMRLYT